ncbi:MAG: chemotaxis protein CheW [Geobacteraceae bacterium GWC2_55_20]|nr:MAG: chemotaxis protein CheW [Geobacteraceae bacterium GWC2_55_20]OGU19902.1 MAG: chemotaxis protein CheW [Geobacteraceae bacterium GWF2_54_21]HBA72091.1 chemotaxis protein CheW [Geobacter sp.]
MEGDLNDIQLACFSLGDKLFAVDIMRIREILLPQKLSSLPRASELLDGVINLRGSVIPVMNMRKRFSMPAGENIKTGKLLIVSLAKQMLALMVDDVMEVITVPARDIKPPILLSSDVGMEYLVGVCLSNERVFMILNVDSLLGSSDLPLSNHMSKSTK